MTVATSPRFLQRWQLDCEAPVAALALAPDGTRIAIATGDGPLLVVDTHSGAIRRRSDGHDGGTTDRRARYGRHAHRSRFLRDSAFRGHDPLLASGASDGSLAAWRLAKRRVVASFDGDGAAITSMVWTNDDGLIVGDADGVVSAWSSSA